MNPTGRLPRNSTDQLLTSQLAAYADAFRHHLSERRYASRTIDVYVACLAVFALWMSRSRLDIDRIDEDAVQRFLDDHLLQCKNSSPGRRNYCNARHSGICSSCCAPSPSSRGTFPERPRWTRSCAASTTI